MKIKTTAKKKKKDSLRLHLYYKLVFLGLGRLGGGRRDRCRSFTLEVFLGGYGESCQHDLHVLGSLFFLGGLFGGV